MKKMTQRAHASVLAYQKRSSSGLFTGTLTHPAGAHKHTVFMPGCALASHSPKLVKTIYQHLNQRLPGLGLLQQCCANPVLSVGDMDNFALYYNKFERERTTHSLHTIITACPNCYMTIKKFSPNLTIRSLYEVLPEVGIPSRDHSAMPPAALHDPCPIRKEAAIHAGVRNLLEQMRYPFEEFGLNRTQTVCCGSGGMLEMIDYARALAKMRLRCAQTECDVIISYCQTCVESLGKGGKRGLHLLDLIFSENMAANFTQPAQWPLRRWVNRYRSKLSTGSFRSGKRAGEAS